MEQFTQLRGLLAKLCPLPPYRNSNVRTAKYLLLLLCSAFAMPSFAVTCTTSGTTATCTGVQLPADTRVSYDAVIDGIDTLVVDSNFSAAGATAEAFYLGNSSTAATHDLTLTMESGATYDRALKGFSFHIRNNGFGNIEMNLLGAIDRWGLVRLTPKNALNTGSNVVNVGVGASVFTTQSNIWIRSESLGSSAVYVAGKLESDDWRVIHLDTFNTLNSAPTIIDIAASAEITLYDGGLRTNHAVYAEAHGPSPVRISSAGIVIANGSGGAGIYAADGLYGASAGDAVTVVITAGSVTGGAGFGAAIHTASPSTSLVNLDTIDIAAGVIINGSAGFAIHNGDSDKDGLDEDGGDVLVNTAGILSGAISLGDGSDTLNFNAGSDFSGVTIIDGGDDSDSADGFIDVLNFNSASGALIASDIINWESIIINSGSTISFDGANTLTTAALTVASGGIMSLNDGAVDDVLTVSGDVIGGGTINIESALGDSASATDLLIVQGDTSSTTTVVIANVGGAGAGTGTADLDGILVIQVGGSSNGVFILSAPVQAGDFAYDLVQGSNGNWYLQSVFAPVSTTVEAIPTLGQWTMVLLSLLLLSVAGVNLNFSRKGSEA